MLKNCFSMGGLIFGVPIGTGLLLMVWGAMTGSIQLDWKIGLMATISILGFFFLMSIGGSGGPSIRHLDADTSIPEIANAIEEGTDIKTVLAFPTQAVYFDVTYKEGDGVSVQQHHASGSRIGGTVAFPPANRLFGSNPKQRAAEHIHREVHHGR